VGSAFAVEIRFAAIRLIGKIAAALDHHCTYRSPFTFLRRNR
jgi:hypothetical protein